MLRNTVILAFALTVTSVACSGGGAESSSQPTTSGPETAATSTESKDTELWEQDACSLLSDDAIAAIGGLTPIDAQPAAQGTVAAEDYGGSSCRWKLSTSVFLTLDVYPSAPGQLVELAGYDPNDRWTPEQYSGVGDDARIVVATGASGLETPGTIQAIVVEDGDVGIRLALTDKYPATPVGLAAAAELVLAQR